MGGRPWRLLLDDAGDGAWNMGVDSALLASRAAGDGPSTLRIYRWRGPTVTLGRFQDVSGVDLGACERLGVDVVRRPTGGRGVLHADEVTYAVVAGVSDGLPRGVGPSYRVLCGVLVEAYERLGVRASLTARASSRARSAACYLHASEADVSLGAAKLSGSAQVWSRDAVLQHGSFVLSRDAALEAEVFGLDPAGAAALSVSATTIEEAAGRRPGPGEVAEALAEALSAALGADYTPSGLTPAEADVATAGASRARLLPSAG